MRALRSEGGDTVHIVPRRLRRLLEGLPPAKPAGPPIQEREREAARDRLLAQARRAPSERAHGRWAR